MKHVTQETILSMKNLDGAVEHKEEMADVQLHKDNPTNLYIPEHAA